MCDHLGVPLLSQAGVQLIKDLNYMMGLSFLPFMVANREPFVDFIYQLMVLSSSFSFMEIYEIRFAKVIQINGNGV